MKTAFITDSGCGLTIKEANELGIFSVPLQIIYDIESKSDLEEITHETIWQLLSENKVLKTSLPSAGVMDMLFEQLKKQGYERVFCVSITKGLSSTANTFELIANQHDLQFIYFDCFTTSFIQRYSIILAKQMYDNGYSLDEIIEKLNYIAYNSDTFVIPADCDQLIKSGRLTGFAATIAGLLKIKPWLHLNHETGGKIDALGKARTQQKLIKQTIEQMKKHVKQNFHIQITHVNALNYAKQVKQDMENTFENAQCFISSLIAPVAVHAGLGCIAIQYYPTFEVKNESN